MWALAPPNILPQSLWQRKRVAEGLVQQSDAESVVMILVTLWTLVIWPPSNCNWMGKCNLPVSQGSIMEQIWETLGSLPSCAQSEHSLARPVGGEQWNQIRKSKVGWMLRNKP